MSTGYDSARFVSVAPDTELFDAVFALAEANKATLGMLTKAAWVEYADRGRVLALVETDAAGDETLAGFAAYRLPRAEVRLAQLVVAPTVRRNGVGHALVTELSRRYANRRGIALRCRRDYDAHRVWPRLGFVPLGERPGRSLQQLPVVSWWRDHGHPDLMSWPGADSSVVPVLIDMNLFLDLYGAPGTADPATREVLTQTLRDRIEIVVAPELFAEIDRHKDPNERRRLQSIAAGLLHVSVHAEAVEGWFDRLASRTVKPTKPRDISDMRHVAAAAAAGMQVVVSRDRDLRRALREAAADEANITITNPHDLVALVDQMEDEEVYWPAALSNTRYSRAEVGHDDAESTDPFFDNGSGEKRVEFTRRLERLAIQRPRSHRLVYRDAAGDPSALIGYAPNDGVLDVTICRMTRSPLQATLAPQLVSLLRPAARLARVAAIRISDPHANDLLIGAALRDGFRATPTGTTVGLTIDAITGADAVSRLAEAASTALTDDERTALRPILGLADSANASSPIATTALERDLRPPVIDDADLDTWLVPIKPYYATQLFGHDEDLFGRHDGLGISIEHVYYRAGRSGESAPGRVLWYVSGQKVVIGCSALVEVVDAPAAELWERFRRLGIYNRADVEKAAERTGTARALRVINTQMFDSPLTLDRLRHLARKNGQTLSLRSPQRLNTGLFGSVIEEGRQA